MGQLILSGIIDFVWDCSSQALNFGIFLVIGLNGISLGLFVVLVLLDQLHSSSEFTAALFGCWE